MSLTKVLKVVAMGMLRFGFPNNGPNNHVISQNYGPVLYDDGNHTIKNIDHADDSRALRSVLNNDLTYDPLIYSSNLAEAAQCGSVIQQVNGQKLNSIVSEAADANPNIEVTKGVQLHLNLPPVPLALNVPEDIRASIHHLDPMFNGNATIHYFIGENDGQPKIQREGFMINYNDDLETGGVIFLPKDSGFPNIPV